MNTHPYKPKNVQLYKHTHVQIKNIQTYKTPIQITQNANVQTNKHIQGNEPSYRLLKICLELPSHNRNKNSNFQLQFTLEITSFQFFKE